MKRTTWEHQRRPWLSLFPRRDSFMLQLSHDGQSESLLSEDSRQGHPLGANSMREGSETPNDCVSRSDTEHRWLLMVLERSVRV